MSFKISVDAGYGYTKVLSSSGFQSVFPSLVGYGRDRLNLFDDKSSDLNLENIQVMIKEQGAEDIFDYFVGELAKRESENATHIMGTDRVSDHRAKALILTACAVAMKDYSGPIGELSVGLPLQYYNKHQESMMESLLATDATLEFTSGGIANKRIRFNRVNVYPQAAGALWAQLFNEKGEMRNPQLSGLVGLIDIGFKTTDFIVIDLGDNMVLRSELSGTIEQGMRQVFDNTQRYFEVQVGSSVDPNEFEKSLMKNDFKFHYSQNVKGQRIKKEYDLRAIFDKYKQELATTIKERVRQKWGSRMNFFDVVFLAGGGAIALNKHFSNFEIESQLCNSPQMANARGYMLMSNMEEE